MEKRALYPLAEFPDLQKLQEHFPTNLKELSDNKLWMPWGSDSYDKSGQCSFLKGDWTICPVYFGNYSGTDMDVPHMGYTELKELTDSLPNRFPETTNLLKKIPSINFAGFSRLYPHSRLEPHKHNNPDSLIFHLGLVIPPGITCGLKVGDQIHTWTQPGDAVIFDDNLEHSAWNDSSEDRILLYIDFVRP